jgi:glycosyltransferase involved in cell wall biosynthesis
VHVTSVDMSLELLLGPHLEAFVQAGYEVIGMSAPGPYVSRLEARGIRHFPLRNSTRAMNPIRDFRAYRELKALFRQTRPDIVHTHNPKPGVYGRLAARAADIESVVNTVHGLYALPDDPLPKRAVTYALERLAARASTVELVQNVEDIPVLRRIGVDAAKIILLGNGIDLDRFSPSAADAGRVSDLRLELNLKGDEVVIGTVGRLVAEKGYSELFAAMRQVRETNPRVRLVVVGPEDPEKSDALSRAQLRRACDDGVVFLGPRKDMNVFYAAIDVFALASHREGFSRSGMEAAAMGLPIVGTDIRGIRQVVDHGKTGILVPVRDPERLARAIRQVVADADMRQRMGASGRRKAISEFDQRSQIELTLEVYEHLLAR